MTHPRGCNVSIKKALAHWGKPYRSNPDVLRRLKGRPQSIVVCFAKEREIRLEWSRWQRFKHWFQRMTHPLRRST